jgi:hypothetical protein
MDNHRPSEFSINAAEEIDVRAGYGTVCRNNELAKPGHTNITLTLGRQISEKPGHPLTQTTEEDQEKSNVNWIMKGCVTCGGSLIMDRTKSPLDTSSSPGFSSW